MTNQHYLKQVKGWKIFYNKRFNSYPLREVEGDYFTSAKIDKVTKNLCWDFRSEIDLPQEVQEVILNHSLNQ